MPTPTRPSRPALLGLALYGGAALTLGDALPPVSTHDALVALGSAREVAILELRADGAPASVHDFDRFSGPILGPLPTPADVPFRMRALHAELEGWIEAHEAPEGDVPGPARLEVGYRVVGTGPEGVTPVQGFVPVVEGRAWSR